GWKYATLKINVTSNGGGSQSAAATTGGSVSGGTNIVGYVPVSVDQLLRPFVARGSGQIDRARRLADLYIKWGQAFNIRADIAWAQMCHETGFLEFTGVARPEWNNFAGIGITGPGAMVTFASEELGVIAHYAHLAWYVYPNDINAYCNRNYDPRHIGAHRFNGDSSLNTLNSRWAPAADYVSKIVYFANQIWG
ncbi:MAG: glucosaminidase domain-containing protein, partial [Candidatus Humimicrobiaceae bacterium]